MKTSKYADLITNTEISKKEDTVPWKNQYTGEIIEVPISKYQYYLPITKEYEEILKEKEKKLEEIKSIFERYSEEIKKQITEIGQRLDEKRNKNCTII